MPIYLHDCECLTALGKTQSTWSRLINGEVGLKPVPPLADSTETVPLALTGDLDDLNPPRWIDPVCELIQSITQYPWGDARHPIVITSSNFGIDQMLAAFQTQNTAYHGQATVTKAVGTIANRLGWGSNRLIISNACVSAQLGMIQAARLLEQRLADRVLVFSFDYLSRFVVGGFHALKILNEDFPQPYSERKSGAIGLGDGAAFAVFSNQPSPFCIEDAATHSEFKHMTGNDPSGAGFDSVLAPMTTIAKDRNFWVKGHGTGTLETGRLEAESVERNFPNAPLVSWKGSIGHTLGSCGLVELAITKAAFHHGLAPGNVAAPAPHCVGQVHSGNLDLNRFDGVILLSSAFGGAHAAHLMTHA
ncbi:MAG: hypothetical protein AAFX93_16930 [Verrucomicrobiota bacterium]